MQSSILKVGSRKSEVGFDGCETKRAGSGFIRKKLVSSRSKALMVHLYHIFSGWLSVLISCIQATKPYVDFEPTASELSTFKSRKAHCVLCRLCVLSVA